MFFNLPPDLQDLILSFDSTYHDIYKNCINQLIDIYNKYYCEYEECKCDTNKCDCLLELNEQCSCYTYCKYDKNIIICAHSIGDFKIEEIFFKYNYSYSSDSNSSADFNYIYEFSSDGETDSDSDSDSD